MEEKTAEKDRKYMERALQLAELGGVTTMPNPKVGAVIVYNDCIIGEGYHRKYGEAHAEVEAVSCVEDLSKLSKSTIYVTLEPCAHHGKTPPCADLIVKQQFKRVVIACQDPFSEVNGKGIQQMKEAGITVESGLLEEKGRWVNRRFFTYHEKKRPYVILKWAETRDGFMDRLPEEREQGINWITQPTMKTYVHKWRSEEQAILVGWRTINTDNPQLNVRQVDAPSPHRFIVDPKGKSMRNAVVYNDGQPTTVICEKNVPVDFPEHIEVIRLENYSTPEILATIYKRKMLSVFVEGGAQTLQHFIDIKTWDECYQLIGKVDFKKGLKAPHLYSSRLIEQKTVSGDIIQHRERI